MKKSRPSSYGETSEIVQMLKRSSIVLLTRKGLADKELSCAIHRRRTDLKRASQLKISLLEQDGELTVLKRYMPGG